jgi:hypothetical protein
MPAVASGVGALLLVGFGVAGALLQSRGVRRWASWAPYVTLAAGPALGLSSLSSCYAPGGAEAAPAQEPAHHPLPASSAMQEPPVAPLVRRPLAVQVENLDMTRARLEVLTLLRDDYPELIEAWRSDGKSPPLWHNLRSVTKQYWERIFEGRPLFDYGGEQFSRRSYFNFEMEMGNFGALLNHERLRPGGDLFALRPLVVRYAFYYLAQIWYDLRIGTLKQHANQLATWLTESSPSVIQAREQMDRVLDAWDTSATSQWGPLQADLLVALVTAFHDASDTRQGVEAAIRAYFPKQNLEAPHLQALRELVGYCGS